MKKTTVCIFRIRQREIIPSGERSMILTHLLPPGATQRFQRIKIQSTLAPQPGRLL